MVRLVSYVQKHLLNFPPYPRDFNFLNKSTIRHFEKQNTDISFFENFILIPNSYPADTCARYHNFFKKRKENCLCWEMPLDGLGHSWNKGLGPVGAHHFGNIPALGCITLGVKRYANFACDIIQGFSFIVHQGFHKKHNADCSRHSASLFFFILSHDAHRGIITTNFFLKIGAGLYAYII